MRILGSAFDRKKIKRYGGMVFGHPFLFGVRLASSLVPRSKNVWAFGHPMKFEGNSKYLFLYVQNEKRSEVTAVWISRNKKVVEDLQGHEYDAAHAHSLRGIWHMLRAKYFVVDTSVEAISYWLSGGGEVVNLFHALPIKKMERDVEKGESTEVLLFHSKGLLKLAMHFLFPWRFVKPSYVASTSPLYTKVFCSMFRIPETRVKETGFPRNDVLLKDIKGSEIGIDRGSFEKMGEWKRRGAKIVLYAPTFRDTGDTSFLENKEDVQRLNALMQKHNALFVLKLHPFMKIKVTAGQYSNILDAAAPTDSYPLLKVAAILVTDYSSIFVDFLLLDRPEIFFAYDLEKYMTKDRELYFDYKEFTPGPKAYNFEDFLLTLGNVLAGEDDFREARAKQRDLCFSQKDGESSARVFQLLRTL